MRGRLSVVMALLLVLPLTGCVDEEVRTDIVLEASGGVTWVHRVLSVRSDGINAAARAEEERAWFEDVLAQGHPARRGLRLLGAEEVTEVVLRDLPPYELRVEATFESLPAIGRRIVELAGGYGTQSIEADGSVIRWTLRLDEEAGAEGADALSEEDGDALQALVGGPVSVRLERGRFLEARGLELAGGGSRATLVQEPEADENGELVFMLVWDAEM